MGRKSKLQVQGTELVVVSSERGDYISLTDMTRGFDGGSALIEQWMRSKDTLLFLGAWESLHNPSFKPHEFEGFKIDAGRNSFYMSPRKWLEATGTIGIYSQSGSNRPIPFSGKFTRSCKTSGQTCMV